ncbi:FACT complex subunit SSRP1 [Cytospora mali]|uniref:FACT complex subunit SSRP1 n=1 Tax=Cytospora mali TaxID=578113 RepID=A0A194VP78_CYTMA|nr:FACT complex subunit SSRP1 [Valsa mali]
MTPQKLQRRIANARGIAPDAALVSPTRPSVEDARVEVHRPDGPAPPPPDARDTGTAAVQKRKYRRHPKMREDLKGQNLTFTEIAKLVGENWQGLNQAEKEPYERQAQAAKEKYNQDLAEYKKTLEYKKYLQYLQDFKAKHATHQDKDGHKRVRLSEPNTGESSATNGHSGRAGRMGSTAGSIGEHTGEPPTRRQRISSIVSNVDSYYAPSVNSLSQRTPGEDSITSPATGYFERLSEPSPAFTASPRDGSSQASVPVRRDPVYVDGVRSDPVAPTRNLPPLADMFDTRPVPNGVPHPNEAPTPHFGLLSRGHETISPAPPTPSLAGDDSRRPSLKTEQSSAGSLSSGSSSYNSSHPRTPIDGPLPIHALLTGGKPFPSYDTAYATNSAAQGRSLSPDDRGTSVYYASERAPSEPGAAGHPMPHINGYYSGPTPMSTHASSASLGRLPYANGRQARVPVPVPTAAPASASAPVPGVRPSGKGDAGMDGISALLQADKIVDRRSG